MDLLGLIPLQSMSRWIDGRQRSGWTFVWALECRRQRLENFDKAKTFLLI